MFRVSHNLLKTYRECPQRYQFIYVRNILDKFARPKPEFTMGQHLHATLKEMLAEVPPKERTKDKAYELLRTVWKTNRTGFASRAEEAVYGKRALAMLEVFLESTLLPQPKLLEHNVQLVIADNLMVTGRIDRIDEDSSGAVHIIDYKTGVFSPEYVDKSQLALYSVLATQGLDLPLVSASYWYLEQNEFVTLYPKVHDFEMIIEEVIRTVQRLHHDQTFLPRPGSQCRWCEFIDICPAKVEAYRIRGQHNNHSRDSE